MPVIRTAGETNVKSISTYPYKSVGAPAAVAEGRISRKVR